MSEPAAIKRLPAEVAEKVSKRLVTLRAMLDSADHTVLIGLVLDQFLVVEAQRWQIEQLTLTLQDEQASNRAKRASGARKTNTKLHQKTAQVKREIHEQWVLWRDDPQEHPSRAKRQAGFEAWIAMQERFAAVEDPKSISKWCTEWKRRRNEHEAFVAQVEALCAADNGHAEYVRRVREAWKSPSQ